MAAEHQRKNFADFKELYPISQKMAENRFESLSESRKTILSTNNSDYFTNWTDEELESELEYWTQTSDRAEKDLKTAKDIRIQLNSSSFILRNVAEENRKALNETYSQEKGNTLVEKIEHFISFTKYCIRQLVDEIKVRKNVATTDLNISSEKSKPGQKKDDFEIDI